MIADDYHLIAFLDFTDSDKRREDLRRMEKGIRNNKHYIGKTGKVYFFIFDDRGQKYRFFNDMMTAIEKNGDRAVLCGQSYDLSKVRK